MFPRPRVTELLGKAVQVVFLKTVPFPGLGKSGRPLLTFTHLARRLIQLRLAHELEPFETLTQAGVIDLAGGHSPSESARDDWTIFGARQTKTHFSQNKKQQPYGYNAGKK